MPWLAELPWVWARPHGESVLPHIVRWEGVEKFEAALAARKGVILVSPHIGSWETLGQAVASASSMPTGRSRPCSPGAQEVDGRTDRRLARPARPEDAADQHGRRARADARAARGGYTGILPDQVPPLGQGVWAPFFGRPAYTMTLLPRLAQQTGAACFLGVCERLPRGAGYAIRFEPFDGTALNDPKATPEAAASAMNEGIERLIRRLPGQYVWDYARYKQPRGERHGSGRWRR